MSHSPQGQIRVSKFSVKKTTNSDINFTTGRISCTFGTLSFFFVFFYKVIYDPVSQDAIAFIVPHTNISRSDLPRFIVSVDEVEQRTGLDFNSLLDDAIENDIEDDIERMW